MLMTTTALVEGRHIRNIMVWDEPSYFGFLKGQTVSMDELNFFARRLDGMTEYEKRVVGVYSSETGIREVKQLINLTYSLQGLSLLTDLTDGNRVGLRLYLDRHLAISEEEKSRMDFNAYAPVFKNNLINDKINVFLNACQK